MARPQDILDFWFGPPGSPGYGRDDPAWFRADPAYDAAVRAAFLEDHAAAAAGRRDCWLGKGGPEDAWACLALILLLDQFPRNLFRGSPRAYATDVAARAAADHARSVGYDLILPRFSRKFFYMPYMHSELVADQRRSLALFEALEEDASLTAARRHLEIVARFGRFPHRNAIVGRATRPEEATFLLEPHSSF